MENLNATVGNQLSVPFSRDGDRVFRVVDTDHFAKSCEGCETLEGSTATASDVENSRVLGNLKRRAKSLGYELQELPNEADVAVS